MKNNTIKIHALNIAIISVVVVLVSLASASKAHGCSEYDGCSDSEYTNNDSYLTYPDTSYGYSNPSTTYTSTAYYYSSPAYQYTSYPDYQSNYTYSPSYQYSYSKPSYTGSYQYPAIKNTGGPITATCYPQPLSTYVGNKVDIKHPRLHKLLGHSYKHLV